jgi:hypothetical protein
LYTFKRRHTIVGEKHVDKDVKVADIPFLDTLLLGQVRIISLFLVLWGNTIKDMSF